MHSIEPHFRWRDEYMAEQDERSPFYGWEYSEFYFENKIYNYLIHPQWDEFGSETLYLKILFVDYERGYAIIELIGEWNDTLNNDMGCLKDELLDLLQGEGIRYFLLIMENVLNFHGSDDSYYEAFVEDLDEEEGWCCFLNLRQHLSDEMEAHDLHEHIYFGAPFNELNWRPQKPLHLFLQIKEKIRAMDEPVYFLD
ncbi:hypothetical protein [Saprospira grandis]|uniref:hypothetical protein n=1 Tax=Saprospira grandis TaxID=1008 RepID=UPI0022DE65EA|nr:hypothetical protein [Saprospira grandis]WBM73906.1 hypothetical protein OP864_13015 [Saprospira grandis]